MSYISAVIQHHPTVCAFDAKSGEPLSWAGLLLDGGFGFMYTNEKHRGKGLQLMFLQLLAQTALNNGFKDVYGSIEPNNYGLKKQINQYIIEVAKVVYGHYKPTVDHK